MSETNRTQEIKRVNYFEGQHLRVDDFKDEQSYHIGMRHRHNRTMHTWGVSRGLEVNLETSRSVKILKGLAIDKDGKEIVIHESVILDVVKYGAVKDDTDYFVTISYREQESDSEVIDQCAGRKSRITETIWPEILEGMTRDGSKIPLAKIRMESCKIIDIDNSIRTKEGCVPNGVVRREGDTMTGPLTIMADLTVDGRGTDPWSKLHILTANPPEGKTGELDEPYGTLGLWAKHIDMPVKKMWGLENLYGMLYTWDSDSLFVGLQTEIDPVTKKEVPDRKDAIIAFGDNVDDSLRIMFTSPGDPPPAPLEFMRITGSGNVGIGTMEPGRAKLEISGKVGNTVALFGKGDQGISLVASWPVLGFNSYFNTGWKSISVGYTGQIHVAQDNGRFGVSLSGNAANADAALNPTEVFSILPSGNVGIGTDRSKHTQKLTVEGNIKLGNRIYGTGIVSNDALWFMVNNETEGSAGHVMALYSDGSDVKNNRVHISGNVGIGEPIPKGKLHVSGEAWFTLSGDNGLRIRSGLERDKLYGFSLPTVGVRGPVAFINEQGGFNQAIVLGDVSESEQETLFGVSINSSDPQNPTTGNEPGWKPRFEINGSGQVRIGTTDFNSGHKLIVDGNAGKTTGGTGWAVISDMSLKKNVKPLKGTLNKILKLRGVNFEWKEPEKHGNQTGKQMGMVAQEVEEVFPEWVGAGSDGIKFLALNGFEALVIEAFKELEVRVKALEKIVKP